MIDLSDGLQFPELFEIAKALNVSTLLSPDLHNELTDGVAALLVLTSMLQGVPWLAKLIPGNIGDRLDGATKALQLVQGLLAA